MRTVGFIEEIVCKKMKVEAEREKEREREREGEKVEEMMKMGERLKGIVFILYTFVIGRLF